MTSLGLGINPRPQEVNKNTASMGSDVKGALPHWVMT